MKVVVIAVLVGACGGGGADPRDGLVDAQEEYVEIDARTPGGQAELGTGSVAFESLVEEQELGLVQGPQGGYHFIVHSRIREMDPGNPDDYLTYPSTVFQIFLADGTRIDKRYAPLYLPYQEDSVMAGAYVLPSAQIAQIETSAVPAIYGTRVQISVRVADQGGRVAHDERWVVAVPYTGVDGGPSL